MKKLYYVFLFIMLFLFFPNNDKINIISFKKTTITVEIKGEVENPGLYQMEINDNISDLLVKSGIKETADLSQINQSLLLADHDVIVIPQKSENVLISINSADLTQLQQIPQIGEKTAQKIIEYRETNGPFQSLEELMKVKGIGQKKFDKMKDYICL